MRSRMQCLKINTFAFHIASINYQSRFAVRISKKNPDFLDARAEIWVSIEVLGELKKNEDLKTTQLFLKFPDLQIQQFRHFLKFTCMNGLPKVSTFKTRFEFQLGCILISFVKIIDELLVVVTNSRIVSGQSTQCTVTQN